MKLPLLNDFIDFIFPKICIISDNPLIPTNSNQYIDDKILKSLERVNKNDLINLKSKLKSDFAYSFLRFKEESDTQKIIHFIKFGGMKRCGYFLGKYFANEFVSINTSFNPELFNFIIPVPLHKIKHRERGYNQSEFICKGMNEILKLNYVSDFIIRIKNTKTQTHLTVPEREINVKNAFEKNKQLKNDLENKNIILVDDVITTGATLNEVIKLLRKLNVNKIMCISLAMAVH